MDRERRATRGDVGNYECGNYGRQLRGEPAEAVRCTDFGRNGGRGSTPRGMRPARQSSQATSVRGTAASWRTPAAPPSLRFSGSPRKRAGAWHAARFGVSVVRSEPQPLCREMFRFSPRLRPWSAARPAPGSPCCWRWPAIPHRPGGPAVVTFPGSVLGAEGEVLAPPARAVRPAPARHPGGAAAHPRRGRPAAPALRPVAQRRGQRAGHPSARRGLDRRSSPPRDGSCDLDRFRPPADSFFPATIAANRWKGRLYAVPWFVDVGMLYWRTDLMSRPPATLRRSRTRRSAGASRVRTSVRAGLAGRPLRGAGDGVQRVSRRLRRQDPRRRAGDRGLARRGAGARRPCATRSIATGSCRRRCSPGTRRSRASRSRTARRRSCATGRTPYSLMQDSSALARGRAVRRGADAGRARRPADRHARRRAARDQCAQRCTPRRPGR